MPKMLSSLKKLQNPNSTMVIWSKHSTRTYISISEVSSTITCFGRYWPEIKICKNLTAVVALWKRKLCNLSAVLKKWKRRWMQQVWALWDQAGLGWYLIPMCQRPTNCQLSPQQIKTLLMISMVIIKFSNCVMSLHDHA